MNSLQAQSSNTSSSKQQQPCTVSQQPGQLQNEDAMLAYMQRLEEHRKRCELSGR
jgi:hypothetical protein